jgi:arylformamidase
MKIEFSHKSRAFTVDLNKGLDVSLPLEHQSPLGAWYLDPPRIEAVRTAEFIGEVSEGSPVNFRNIFFNPHAHTTHTESLAHISTEDVPVNSIFSRFHFVALVHSIEPEEVQGDRVLMESDTLKENLNSFSPEAILIRTFPNDSDKKKRNYSHTNPAYMSLSLTKLLRDGGIQHLLIDTPSVDREEDGGALAAHHTFWNYPENMRREASISEFIFVPNEVPDGLYLLNLVPANIRNDAAISRPILFPMVPK